MSFSERGKITKSRRVVDPNWDGRCVLEDRDRGEVVEAEKGNGEEDQMHYERFIALWRINYVCLQWRINYCIKWDMNGCGFLARSLGTLVIAGFVT